MGARRIAREGGNQEADGIVLNKDTHTLFPVYVDIIYR